MQDAEGLGYLSSEGLMVLFGGEAIEAALQGFENLRNVQRVQQAFQFTDTETKAASITTRAASGLNNAARESNNVISNAYQQIRKYWTKQTTFKNVKVYQRNDIFDPKRVSTWSVNGKLIEGTNLQRMAAGRAPIGIDGNPVNLHHMLQSEKVGGIAEMTQTFHKVNSRVLHINPNTIPSGIDRNQFKIWCRNY